MLLWALARALPALWARLAARAGLRRVGVRVAHHRRLRAAVVPRRVGADVVGGRVRRRVAAVARVLLVLVDAYVVHLHLAGELQRLGRVLVLPVLRDGDVEQQVPTRSRTQAEVSTETAGTAARYAEGWRT